MNEFLQELYAALATLQQLTDNDKRNQAEYINNVAASYLKQEQWLESAKFFKQAAEVIATLQQLTDNDKRNQAEYINNVAASCFKQEQWSESAKLRKQGAEVLATLQQSTDHDKYWQAVHFHDGAVSCRNCANFAGLKHAMISFQQALSVLSKITNRDEKFFRLLSSTITQLAKLYPQHSMESQLFMLLSKVFEANQDVAASNVIEALFGIGQLANTPAALNFKRQLLSILKILLTVCKSDLLPNSPFKAYLQNDEAFSDFQKF